MLRPNSLPVWDLVEAFTSLKTLDLSNCTKVLLHILVLLPGDSRHAHSQAGSRTEAQQRQQQ